MTTDTEVLLPPGTRLAHYEIRRLLGSGAMGNVYLAHDEALDRAVALKVLRPRIAAEQTFVDRFFREARAAARVSHPNLVHVYFVGKDTEGRPFFSMEVVPGKTLDEFVDERGPLSLEEAADLVVQAARGLGAAHALGVVHRDVKPSNLLRRDDGVLKVTDFGLARSMDADVNASTAGLTGTPTYMSPEQCKGRVVDARSDIYSLGLVFWYLLTGKAPFESQSIGELLNQQMNEPVPSLAARRTDLPPAVDRVLAILCAKDPASRPTSMDEVATLVGTLKPREVHLAPIVTRAVATSIDGMLALIVALASFALVEWTFSTVMGGDGSRGLFVEVLARLSALVASLGVFACVFLGPELWWGATFGKFLMGLRVLRSDGNEARSLQIVARLCVRYPGLLLLTLVTVVAGRGGSANVIWIIGFSIQAAAVLAGVVTYFVKDGRTLSDVCTGTRVAYSLGGAPPRRANAAS